MKKQFKKLASMLLILVMLASVSINALVAYASSDNNYSYKFQIEANETAKYSEGKFRSTSNNYNAWKVNLQSSGEGEKTITKFRLCLNDGTGASAWHSVTQGSGAHYYSTNDAADFRTVYLQGRNNNDSTKKYTVSGVWDEETGLIIG